MSTEIFSGPEKTDLKKTNPEKKNWKRRALKISGFVGAAAAAGFIFANSTYEAPESIGDIGFTPTGEVNPSSSQSLIEVTDSLITAGPYAVGAGALGLGMYEYARRRKGSRTEAQDKFTKSKNHKITVGIVAGIAAVTANAIGIGNTAADNAAEPIEQATAMYGAGAESTHVITGYEGALGNHMPVDKYDITAAAIREAGGNPMPLIFELGKVEDPSRAKEKNPTAGPIAGISAEVLQQNGINLPPIEKCEDMSVLVGEQLFADDELNASAGKTVTINGRPAHVAGTVDIKPGLGRVMAVGREDQIAKCIYPNSEMIIASGLTIPQSQEVLAKVNNELDTAYVARSFDDLVEENQEFWDGSVKPSQATVIAQNLALGAAGIGMLEGMGVASRRKKFAVRLSRDVSKMQLGVGEVMSVEKDVAKAIIPGLGLYAVLTYAYNTSMYGISGSANVGNFSAGVALTALAAGIATAVSSAMTLRKINVNEELKGGA